jgi:2-polyprenyl-3-methyl-5-hydroxy-6-metoxy-1,4-benzoquinol methylase
MGMHSNNISYYTSIRRDIISLVSWDGNARVLDVGCGEGETGRELKEKKLAKEVVGIEIHKERAKTALKKLDRVISGDIETLDIPYPEKYFDVIILGDILEHLKDPWQMLFKLKNLLKDDGVVASSIPNVRNWGFVIKPLLFHGEFKYCKEGILDINHLRFFTKKSIFTLFNNTGFKILKTIPVYQPFNLKKKLFKLLFRGNFREILVTGYLILSKKS